MPKLSVTIITLNEAEHIAAAIDSAAFADEIIVVDSGSTDGTVDIARRKGVVLIEREWPGWIAQKNFAAGQARNDWIFSLDADERPIAELSLQGHSTAEISAQLGRAERSVRRLRERVRLQLERLQAQV